jgi:hypothetical protein
LVQLGQWTAKQKLSDLLSLQVKIDQLHNQFIALMAENTKLKNKVQISARPSGAPKTKENEERAMNGTKWFYCNKCWSDHQWTTTHKSHQHKRGMGRTKDQDDKDKTDRDASKNCRSILDTFWILYTNTYLH